MPAPLSVDREQVRMLVLDHGPREAARMTGIAEGTVLAWSKRFGWLQHIHEPPQPPASMRPKALSSGAIAGAIVAIKPAQAKADRLLRECGATTSAMSSLALKTALAARNTPLVVETPADLLALAKAHATIHRLESQESKGAAPPITFNVGFLLDCQSPVGLDGEIRDVSAEVVKEGGEGPL